MKHFDRFETLKVAWESLSQEEMLLMKNYKKGDRVCVFMGLVKVLRAFQEEEITNARKITKNSDNDSVEVNNIITINSINCL